MRSALILFIFIFTSFAHASDYDPNATRNQRPGVQKRASRGAVTRSVSNRAASAPKAPAVLAMPNSALNGTIKPTNISLLPPNSRLATSLPAVNGPMGQPQLVQIPGAYGVPVVVPADALTSQQALQSYVASHPYMAGRLPVMGGYNPCPAPGTPCNYIVPGSGVVANQMAPQSASPMPMSGFPPYGQNLFSPGLNPYIAGGGLNGFVPSTGLPGPGASSPQYSGPFVRLSDAQQKQGMCISTNQSNTQLMNWCGEIHKALDTGCAAQFVDQLASGPIANMDKTCSQYSSFAGDREKRIQFYQNLIAAIVTEESSWNPNAKDGDGGTSVGLMSLTPGSDSKTYGACSDCAQLTWNNVLSDPALNLRCGTYIAMYWLAKDRDLGSGAQKWGNARGIPHYFGPTGDSQPEKQSRIRQRAQGWCTAHANEATDRGVASVPDASTAK